MIDDLNQTEIIEIARLLRLHYIDLPKITWIHFTLAKIHVK